jgi:hypothetical protein
MRLSNWLLKKEALKFIKTDIAITGNLFYEDIYLNSVMVKKKAKGKEGGR